MTTTSNASLASNQRDLRHSTDCGLVSLHRVRGLPVRKLMLISALLLASASAQAGELLLASDAAPHAYSTNHAEPLPPLAKHDKDDSQMDDRAAEIRAAKMRMEARRYQVAKMRRYGF
jgi:hypothetical protein